mmetsp:Transcript_21250/g.15559  ORF Transcript_21250/g.15559 Transcript_21250/m.15559 type:complete len:146 (+) Transcript_21250:447-884(+)
MASDKMQTFMKDHKWMFWLSFSCTFTLIMFLFCFNFLVRKVPWNYLVLFAFTLFDTYMIASISIFHNPEDVLIAGVVTVGMFFGLSLVAFFSKLDITYCTGLIGVITWSLIFMTVLLLMFPGKGVMIGCCTGCIVIIGIFIIYDT